MPLRKLICDNCTHEFSLFLSYSDLFNSQLCPECNKQVARLKGTGISVAAPNKGAGKISKPN